MMDSHVALKIIRSRILVLSVRTERTDVSRRVMHKSMSDHLILSLEPFTAFSAWAALYRTVVRAIRRVNIGMRV